MIKIYNTKKRKITLLCVFFLLTGNVKGAAEDRVVLRVNGHEINSCDIMRFLDSTPEHRSSLDAQQDEKNNPYDKRRLKAHIMRIIHNEAMEEYGIVVSENEVTERLEKLFSQAGIDNDIAIQIREKGLRIVESLKKVVINGLDPHVVYLNTLENDLNGFEWNAYVTSYDTPAKIDSFEKLLPNHVQDMKDNSRKSCKNDLKLERLYQYIYSGIFITDEEVMAYCQNRLKKNPEAIQAEVKDQIADQLLEERQIEAYSVWFKKRISHAKIEVFDDRFKDIKNEMIQEFSHREDPRKALLKVAKMFTNTPPQEVLEAECTN